MSETKEEIAAQRDQLLAENHRLREAHAAAGRAQQGPTVAQWKFSLSEGERQELEIYGVVSIGGRLMTIDQVRQHLAAAGETGVPLADPPAETDQRERLAPELNRSWVRGFDYIGDPPAAARPDAVTLES